MSDELKRLKEIEAALPKRPWRYDPKHEMFIGTTNAIIMPDRVLDLGRDGKEFYPYKDETGSGYRITEASRMQYERTVALGAFLEQISIKIEKMLAIWAAAEKAVEAYERYGQGLEEDSEMLALVKAVRMG